ncbi:MAG: nucleotidyltransferase family protein [Stenomitos rutilans HA7619-LM2]|nr:nucleotidyltransferase family protein [Stenomitos rutilans HA7619-LM2]
MGSPKQLLPYRGRSLLRYTAEVALASNCEPIVVVLGANSDRIHPTIANLPVHIVENNQWSEGMGSSIRAGVEQITRINPHLDAVVVMLCDQPLVTASKLNQLLEAYQVNRSQVIASAYANTLGVPALFSRDLFPDLLSLTANVGAKYLIQQYRDQVYVVPFPEGAIDLDTPEDYQQMRIGVVPFKKGRRKKHQRE